MTGVGVSPTPELIRVGSRLLGPRSVAPSHTSSVGRKSPTRNGGFCHSRRVLARWKSLVEGAGVLRRAGKDFFGTPWDRGGSEKTFWMRRRATSASTRLFWRAGEPQRVKKVFFRTLEDASVLEKSFPARWRTNRGRKSSRFWCFRAGSRFGAGDSVKRSTSGRSGLFGQHHSATRSVFCRVASIQQQAWRGWRRTVFAMPRSKDFCFASLVSSRSDFR